MIHQTTLTFLTDLAAHNHKEWFEENRSRYKAARENVISFVDELMEEMLEFEPDVQGLEARKCLFRINRDVRFSKDKSPYKTNFGASISRGGRKSGFVGYYLQIQPGSNMIAGGSYMPAGPELKKIRAHIDLHAPAFREILAAPSFVKHFGEMQGPELKTAPKGYERDHPAIDLLRKKSFTVFAEIDDAVVLEAGFKEQVLAHFKAMKPFLNYLNAALKGSED